jgi:hypothetical protein
MPNREKDTPRVSANTKRDIDVELGPKRGTGAGKSADPKNATSRRAETSGQGRGGV